MAPATLQPAAIPGKLDDGGAGAAHVMFIPSAEMSHLVPFFRFITALSSHGVHIHCSVVTVLPTVTAAEADHLAALLAAFPRVQRVDFNLLPLDASAFPPGTDPFQLRWEALRRSAHLLDRVIAGATPRVSAVVADVTLTSHVVPVARQLQVPCHVLFTSSATMLSLVAYFPIHLDLKKQQQQEEEQDTAAGAGVGDVDIPGVRRIPQSALPQPLHKPKHLFTTQFIENGRALSQADGILVNTFDALEPVALAALRDGKVVPGFPPVYAIGLLKSSSEGGGEKQAAPPASSPSSPVIAWLGEQPARSVVYVAFGSRIAVSHEQLREMGAGLEASGCRFLWALKTTMVDREDTAEARDVLGDEFLERVKGRGLVTKGWVEQEAVLRHAAVGLFLSHSGWNSATEAAASGVPLLAWPRGGDQRVNAMVMESAGAGVWMERWSWDGEDGVVSGTEIGEKVKAAMADAALRAGAARASQEAAMAVAVGGTSYRSMQEFIGKL